MRMMDATRKQIKYADNIHRVTGIPLPKKKTKENYWSWIRKHEPEYQEKISRYTTVEEEDLEELDMVGLWID